MKAKLDALKIAHRIVWESGPGEETRERVEAVKRWFVHDWQTLDNKIKSSIVEGVSVFLAMFDMPDVAKVFCPAAPHIPDDPEAIILQAQLRRIKAEKEAKEAKEAKAKKPKAAEIAFTWGVEPKAAKKPKKAAAEIKFTWGGGGGGGGSKEGGGGGETGRQETGPRSREEPGRYFHSFG